MGGAVVMLFFLPWLDRSPVKSIRYRPGWHKVLYGLFFAVFVVLCYSAPKPPSTAQEPDRRRSARSTTSASSCDADLDHARHASRRRPIASRSIRIDRSADVRSKAPHEEIARHPACSSRSIAWGATRNTRSTTRRTWRNDQAALQSGAKLFVNYCLNCHNASSMRYSRLADLGLTEDQIKKNLLFTSDKIGDLMRVAMPAKDAKEWFGAVPPDLSVIARAKIERTRHRPRLHLLVPAHVLQGRHASDRLEQPRLSELGDAARAVAAAGRARRRSTSTRRTRRARPVHEFEKFDAADARHADAAAIRPRRGRHHGVPDLDGRAAQRRRASTSACGCCCSSVVTFVLVWRLNASYWKEVK